jgi:hypothetical protein
VLVSEPDDRNVITVYQVKSFHSNLETKHKGQIERSYRRLLAYAQAKNLMVKEWLLTLPLNQTNENREWLADITREEQFPSDWRGLDYLEGLAAKYPDVVDYYLHNGRQRLEGATSSLNDTIRMLLPFQGTGDVPQPGSPLQPYEFTEGLTGLHQALNNYDPFYIYNFSVDHECQNISNEPFLVAAKQISLDKQCITFKIFSKMDEALVERPIPITINFQADINTELHRDLELFNKYGRPFEAPAGSATVNADLPGGLGGKTSQMTKVKISRPMTDAHHEVRNSILDGAGVVLAEVFLKMEPPTVGSSRQGMHAFGIEENGVFTLEMLTEISTRNSQITLSLGDLAGLRPNQILPGLRFMENFRRPHRLKVSSAYGPPQEGIEEIPEGPAANVAELIDFVEALKTIQEHTSMLIEIPRKPQRLTASQIDGAVEAAQLLRGETLIREWTKIASPFDLSQEFQVGDLLAPSRREPLVVKLGNAKISLGTRELRCSVARVDSIADYADHRIVQFVPAGETRLAISLADPNREQ